MERKSKNLDLEFNYKKIKAIFVNFFFHPQHGQSSESDLYIPVDEIIWYAGELGFDQDEEAPAEVKHVPGTAGRPLLFPEDHKIRLINTGK